MWMMRVTRAGLLLLTVAAAGCEQNRALHAPTAPAALNGSSINSATEDLFAALVGTEDLVSVDLVGDLDHTQSAAGHGNVAFVKDVHELKQAYSFSFTARREETGPPDRQSVKAHGQFEFHPESTTELKVHGQVTCLTVLASKKFVGTAVIGGIVTHSNAKELTVGQEVVFSATDVGEGGSNSNDALSPLLPVKPGEAMKRCVFPTAVTQFVIRDGNIQVPWTAETAK